MCTCVRRRDVDYAEVRVSHLARQATGRGTVRVKRIPMFAFHVCIDVHRTTPRERENVMPYDSMEWPSKNEHVGCSAWCPLLGFEHEKGDTSANLQIAWLSNLDDLSYGDLATTSPTIISEKYI